MDHLQAEIAQALRQAPAERRRGRKFFVRAHGETHPILRQWDGGFTIAREDAPRLRGFVDLMLGDQRLARCLIVLAEEETDGIIRYEYKRRTEESSAPPRDYDVSDNAPVALLT